jgi:hypothetical protein
MSLASKARQNLQKKQPIIENGFTKTHDHLVDQQELLEAAIKDNERGMTYYELEKYDSEGNEVPFEERHYRVRYRSRVLEKLTEPIYQEMLRNPNVIAAFVVLALLIILMSSIA